MRDVPVHVLGVVVLGAVELEVTMGPHDHVDAMELVEGGDAVPVGVGVGFDVVGPGEEVD